MVLLWGNVGNKPGRLQLLLESFWEQDVYESSVYNIMNEGKLYVKLYTMLKTINMDLGFWEKKKLGKKEEK